MPTTYLLDSGPLGLLAHGRLARRIPIQQWIARMTSAGDVIAISEVADFEVRRELTRLVRSGQLPASRLDRLDRLTVLFKYIPMTTAMWRRAAEFWSDARLQGIPTASAASLDGDVLIAAQAAEIVATVVTSNASHIGRWVPVLPWP